MGIRDRDPQLPHSDGEHRRQPRHTAGDPLEPLRAVVDRVHRGHNSRQHLRGADVACRLLAADVLLTGLERQAIGGAARRVHAHSHEPPRQRPLELVAAGKKGGMRPATARRHPESLRGANDDVGPPLARWHENREGQWIGRHAEDSLPGVNDLGEVSPVGHFAVGRGIRHEHAKTVAVGEQVADITYDEVDPQRLGAGGEHLDHLRMAAMIDKEPAARARCHAAGERHRLGGRRRLVEQRCVGDRHRRQVTDHRLEVDKRLHPALRDLGLVGRVGGVPGRILEHVAEDHRRRPRGVVALADEARDDAVCASDTPQLLKRCRLRHGRRQLHRVMATDPRRHDLVDQRGERLSLDRGEHGCLVSRRDADVTGGEVGRFDQAAGNRAD